MSSERSCVELLANFDRAARFAARIGGEGTLVGARGGVWC